MKEKDLYNIPSEACTKINEWLLKFPDGEKKTSDNLCTTFNSKRK